MDDTVIFGHVNPDHALVIKWTCKTFEIWSGLKINFNKSHITPLGEIDIRMLIIKDNWIQREGFPITYLGIPLRQIALRKDDWNVIIGRLQWKLKG